MRGTIYAPNAIASDHTTGGFEVHFNGFAQTDGRPRETTPPVLRGPPDGPLEQASGPGEPAAGVGEALTRGFVEAVERQGDREMTACVGCPTLLKFERAGVDVGGCIARIGGDRAREGGAGSVGVATRGEGGADQVVGACFSGMLGDERLRSRKRGGEITLYEGQRRGEIPRIARCGVLLAKLRNDRREAIGVAEVGVDRRPLAEQAYIFWIQACILSIKGWPLQNMM